jgi:four helix bundle protein
MNVEDLKVYQKLCSLVIEVNDFSLKFPKFELYELGSQIRRSSNSSAANLAEGFDNKHTNIYLECISRSLGEIRETQHHLRILYRKKYFSQEVLDKLLNEYTECTKMLYGLQRSLLAQHRK